MANKYSLHLGLNAVDKSRYKAKYRDLKNAENDARLYYSIAQKRGFNSTVLLGPDATSDRLISNLTYLAGKMTGGGLLFLTFSGHGTKAIDQNGDETDRKDEVLVLYDRLFIDDEFPNYWQLFGENTNIFFVNDSCFNGSVSRFFITNKRNIDATFRGHIFRGIDAEEADIDFKVNLDYYRSLTMPASKPACSVIHMGACQDNQLASDGGPGSSNGLFTSTFNKLYADGAYNGSYLDFFSSIQPLMPRTQIPTWDTGAGVPSTDFEHSKFLEV